MRLHWDPRPAIGVVVAAKGYPGKVRSGDAIAGLDVPMPAGVKAFHAGTRERDGAVVTAGGRVLTVCALGEDFAAARERAYAALGNLHFDGAFHRRDIGHRALTRSGMGNRE
jgi:phosphoribosylamine--glycine ligase